MTWIPPFYACGECGGEIGRWPMVNLLKQEVLDWRHRSVPEGVGEHRAILGTPAHRPRVLDEPPEPTGDEEEVLPDPVPPPEVPARRAAREELPASAQGLWKLAGEHGWAVEAWYMKGPRMSARWKVLGITESVVLRLHRDGHRLIACWQRGEDGGDETSSSYGFDLGMSLTHWVEMIGSPELRKIVKAPRSACEQCGEPVELHVKSKYGHICWGDWRRTLGPDSRI